MPITQQEASSIFDDAFAKSGRKTLYWNEKETAVAAIMEGREAYLSKQGADNHWAYNCAHQSSGGPDHEDRRYASLRDWLERQDWLPVESLETRLDWIIPLNEAAANALCAEYSRLGTFREEIGDGRTLGAFRGIDIAPAALRNDGCSSDSFAEPQKGGEAGSNPAPSPQLREAVTSKPGWDGRSFIDARSSEGWAA